MPDPFDDNPEACAALLARVVLGDRGAADALVGLLAPIIRRVAARNAPPPVREDLIQDVWTHLWSHNCRVLQQWNRTGPLAHYVAVVAANLMRDRLARRQIVADPIDDCPDPPDPDDPERSLEVQQLAECLRTAREYLSQMHRELISMRHDRAMTHREIAAALGRTMGYVAATLARAERNLRTRVMEICADHLGGFRSIF